MDPSLRDAKQDLATLPDSPRRTEALQLLDNIERSDGRIHKRIIALEETLQKLEPTETQQRLWRWVPWISIALACCATYSGITAFIGGEFCGRTRRGLLVCSQGLNAQLQGLIVTLIGLMLFLLALPISRLRTAGLFCGGALILIAFFGVTVFRL